METLRQIFSVIWKIIKWLFVTSWGLTLLLLALVDLWLGDGSWWRSLTASNRGGRGDDNKKIDEIQEEIYRSTTDEIVANYGNTLKKYVKSKSTMSIEALILEKIENSPRGKFITEILSPEEMEILFEMMVRAFRASGIS